MVLFGYGYLLLFICSPITFPIHSFVLDPSYPFLHVSDGDAIDIGGGLCLLNVDGLRKALLVPADDCALVRIQVGH